MSLLSIFTLKSDIKKLFSKENITNLKNYIAEQIEAYVDKNLKGPEKKKEVDEKVCQYIKTKFTSKNTYVNLLVSLLISFEPQISQFIYDDLEKFVKGLTTQA